ncbi:hypothetical protein [Kitasatospora sp. NPDC091207]|uniref:hypothetical protein n=1 Tax=Kitasatospora sp. NPDC091207 TaxID=3364083 RepID=UPI003818385E
MILHQLCRGRDEPAHREGEVDTATELEFLRPQAQEEDPAVPVVLGEHPLGIFRNVTGDRPQDIPTDPHARLTERGWEIDGRHTDQIPSAENPHGIRLSATTRVEPSLPADRHHTGEPTLRFRGLAVRDDRQPAITGYTPEDEPDAGGSGTPTELTLKVQLPASTLEPMQLVGNVQRQ